MVSPVPADEPLQLSMCVCVCREADSLSGALFIQGRKRGEPHFQRLTSIMVSLLSFCVNICTECVPCLALYHERIEVSSACLHLRYFIFEVIIICRKLLDIWFNV